MKGVAIGVGVLLFLLSLFWGSVAHTLQHQAARHADPTSPPADAAPGTPAAASSADPHHSCPLCLWGH